MLNPGSDEAIRAGCKCPQMDNLRGRGLYTDASGRVQFVINEECPLHGAKGIRKKEEECQYPQQG